jgi:hypothetical protein
MRIIGYAVAGLIFAALLTAIPVHAASVALSDDSLAAISGKDIAYVADTASTIGTVSTGSNALIQGDSSAIIQVASFTWSDDHSTDASNHKGANDVSGVSSQTQQNVVAQTNGINWGAAASSDANFGDATNTTSLDGTFMTYAAQHVGGF